MQMSSFGPIQVGNNYFLTGLCQTCSMARTYRGPPLLQPRLVICLSCVQGSESCRGCNNRRPTIFQEIRQQPFKKHRRMHSVLKSQAQRCNKTNPNHLSFQPPVMHLAVVLCGLPQGLLSALAFQKLLTTALCLRA